MAIPISLLRRFPRMAKASGTRATSLVEMMKRDSVARREKADDDPYL